MRELQIRLKIVEHRDTGLKVAMSDDMRGLLVHGRDMEELERRVPEMIRALLEASGKHVISVAQIEPTGPMPKAFEAHEYLTRAKLAA